MIDFTNLLLEKRDEKYKEFSKKLIPDTNLPIIGVRTPAIKQLANYLTKEYYEECFKFVNQTHTYYEEVLLSSEIISKIYNSPNELIVAVERFLPKIDNWAICDCFASSLKKVKKYREIFLKSIINWLNSAHIYTIRFAINLLLRYYIDKEYVKTTISLTKDIKSDEYYVNMALSWLWCECLIKFYDISVKYIESKKLTKFVQNKSIRKCIESYRIIQDKKSYLKTLKI